MYYKILPQFLSKEECGQLIDMARPRLEAATTWDVQTRQRQVSNFRTNEFMFFLPQENELVRSIEERIAAATGYPIENGEGLQCARYHPGQYFRAHWDGFDPGNAGNQEMLITGGQRVMTFMAYLNDVPEGYGGETFFVHENMRVRPEVGKGLYWNNNLPDQNDQNDPSTMHEAVATMHPFQKWIITKWIRKGPFVAANPMQYNPSYASTTTTQQQQQQQQIQLLPQQQQQQQQDYAFVQGPPLVHQELSAEEQKKMQEDMKNSYCCPDSVAEEARQNKVPLPLKRRRGRPRKIRL